MKHLFDKYERVDAIRLLKKAKKRIKNGTSWAVCSALSESVDGWEESVACNVLRREIMTRILPASYVTGWLRAQGIDTHSYDDQTEYRIRWINSMIKELF